MVRGGPAKRTRTVSTRLSPQEWQAWNQRRQTSGRKEMGAWVRAVVGQAEGIELPPERRVLSAAPPVPEINRDAYRQLVGAANNLNQIARRVNLGLGVGTDLADTLDELKQAARAVTGR